MKTKAKALLATSVLAVSLILALLILPSPGADRASFVFATSFPTETTCIEKVTIYSDSPTYAEKIAGFYATGETDYAEVGQSIERIESTVRISKDYAVSEAEAKANARVYITISHPTAGTIYADNLDADIAVSAGDFYIILFTDTISSYTLVAGTYTVATLYQIYA